MVNFHKIQFLSEFVIRSLYIMFSIVKPMITSFFFAKVKYLSRLILEKSLKLEKINIKINIKKVKKLYIILALYKVPKTC